MSTLAFADPDLYSFDSPEQTARYHRLVSQLRCPMCLNTNLVGSDAPIAKDLRAKVHSMISTGHSDADILAFMQARYGDFVLYKPPLSSDTWVLWFGPVVMLLGGLTLIVWRLVIASRLPPGEDLMTIESDGLTSGSLPNSTTVTNKAEL